MDYYYSIGMGKLQCVEEVEGGVIGERQLSPQCQIKLLEAYRHILISF